MTIFHAYFFICLRKKLDCMFRHSLKRQYSVKNNKKLNLIDENR